MRTILPLVGLVLGLGLSAPAAADLPTEDRVEAAREAVERAPAQLAPRLRLVELLVRDRAPELALAEIRLLRALHPREAESTYWRARALLELDRLAEAEEALDERMAAAPADVRAQALRARVREERGDHVGAWRDFEDALGRAPALDLFLGRARALERIGHPEEALQGLLEGLAQTGGAVVIRDRAFALARRVGDERAALALADEILATHPTMTLWRVRRAAVLADGGDAALAQAELTRALDDANVRLARRASPLALQERARVLLELGRREEASRDLQQALRRSPSLLDARRLLAMAGSDR